MRGSRLAEVIRGASISLGANAVAEQDAARASASNRMWKVLGCGGFFLGPWVADMDAFAVDGRHCAWYRSPEEAADRARWFLDSPRGEAADRGRGASPRARASTPMRSASSCCWPAVSTSFDRRSDERVVAELEDSHPGQPLDHA